MAGEVVVPERRLGEEDVALLDRGKHRQGVAPVAPPVAEVDHERHLVADELAALANAVDEPAVGDQVAEEDLHLHGSEPRGECALGERADRVHHLAEVSPADGPRPERRVWPDPVLTGAAEQLVHRPPELLSGEVVHRHVNGGKRVHPEPPAAVVDRGGGQVVPERFTLERIAPEEEPAEAPAPCVDVLHEDELANGERRSVGLSDAGATLLVGELDDDRLARAVKVLGIARRAKDESLDVCDRAHLGSPVEDLTTTSGSAPTTTSVGSPPSSCSTRASTAAAPSSARGVRTVVSGGRRYSASGMSS